MHLFCFFIGNQEIGINIGNVIETSSIETFTVLPNVPKFIVGLVNLRGEIVPIISLIKFLQMNYNESLSKVIYLKRDDIVFGVSITSLSKTIQVEEKDILPYPKNVSQELREYYSGIIHYGERNIQILDVDTVINSIRSQVQ